MTFYFHKWTQPYKNCNRKKDHFCVKSIMLENWLQNIIFILVWSKQLVRDATHLFFSNSMRQFLFWMTFSLIWVTNLWCHSRKMSTFLLHIMFCGVVKNAERPGGQGLNLCLFPVKSCSLVGGSGVPWHFLVQGVLFTWPRDSAASYRHTENKDGKLHRTSTLNL